MRLKKYLSFFVLLSISTVAYGFEPVSIDEFFAKNPHEKPIQPTIGGGNIKKPTIIHRKILKDADGRVSIPDYNPAITKKSLSYIDVLLVDRVIGRSSVIKFKTGQSKKIGSLFDVTIKSCTQKETEFSQRLHIVNMSVVGLEESHSKKPLALYDNNFYIELPGYAGFEHPYYDIKPIKCY